MDFVKCFDFLIEKNKLGMGRSKWKYPFVDTFLVKKVFLNKVKKKGIKFLVKTWARSTTICSDFVGLHFRVHNGKDFFPLFITSEMVGYKLGEFVPTRVRYEFKKRKKRKV